MGFKERLQEIRQQQEINRLQRKGRSVRRKIVREKERQEQDEFNKELLEETKKARRETYREEAIKQARLQGREVAERRGTRKARFKSFAKKTGMSFIKKPTPIRRAPVKRRTTIVKRRKTIRRTPIKRVVRRKAPKTRLRYVYVKR